MYSKILDKSAWYGPEEEEKTDWIYNLDYDDIAEINYEADKFINSENDITKINSSNFNLPNLKKKYLEIIDEELKSGRGFALIRGMPTDKWDIKKNIVAYMGLCSFFGNYRVQNKKGHLLGLSLIHI